MADAPPVGVTPVRLRVTGDRRRLRLAVLVRAGLLWPHGVVLQLRWMIAGFAIVAGWWCALVAGRVPRRLHGFVAATLRYEIRVLAYALLLADPFPGFTTRTAYPVDLELPGPGRRSRLRALAYLPILAVLAAAEVLVLLAVLVLAPVAWVCALVAGRVPARLQRTGAALLSWHAQSWAFGMLVTDRLPGRRHVTIDAAPWAADVIAVPERAVRRARRGARLFAGLGLAALAAGFGVAAVTLWHTTVPGDLVLGHPDPARYFHAGPLQDAVRAQDAADRWRLAGSLAALVALALFAWRGSRLARHSAAGPIGTGVFLAMLGIACAVLAAAPFTVLSSLAAPGEQGDQIWFLPLELLGEMTNIAVVAAVALALARRLPRRWWLVAGPVLAAPMVAFTLIAPLADVGPRLEDPVLLRDARELARREGIPHRDIHVIDLRDETRTSPGDAFAVDGGSSAEVVLVGALDTRRELRIVLGHEIGHVARAHVPKDLLRNALFFLLAAGLVALALRRRGSLANPALVPLALLVLGLAQFAWTPVDNAVSRRYEAEADWMALQATRDPRAAVTLMGELAAGHDAAPVRPWWSRAMFEDHPDLITRIAMAEAWAKRERGHSSAG